MALVLSRFEDERIVIGENIVVTVARIYTEPSTGRLKVRLAIDAPGHVSIHRQEVYDAIQRSKDTDLPPRDSLKIDPPVEVI